MAKSQPLTRKQLEEKITALAWKDDSFRKKFLADPKKQFEERLGIKLPSSLKMTAYAEDETSLHFVIPAKPRNAGELNDQDLEKVAGGVDITITIAATVLAAVTGGIATAVTADAGSKPWGG